MVEAAFRVIGEGPSKSSKQCKVQYQQVSHHLSVLGFCSPLLAQGRIQACQELWDQSGFGWNVGLQLVMVLRGV